MELTIWRKAIANIGFIPLTTSGMLLRELARGSITTLRVAIVFYWCGYNHLFTDGIDADMNLNKQLHLREH